MKKRMKQLLACVKNIPRGSMMSSEFPAGIKESLYVTRTVGRIALTVANQRLKYVSAFDIQIREAGEGRFRTEWSGSR
jgi:hypothetical protein